MNCEIKLNGNIDQFNENVKILENTLKSANEYRKIIIDLSDVVFANSMLLNSLIKFCKKYKVNYNKVILANVPHQIKTMLTHTNLDNVFHVLQDNYA